MIVDISVWFFFHQPIYEELRFCLFLWVISVLLPLSLRYISLRMETIRVWSGDLRTKKKKRNSWDEESSFIIYLMFKASLFLIKESSYLNIVQAWFFFHQPISGVKMFIQLKDTCFIYVDVWWLYVCIQTPGFFVKQIAISTWSWRIHCWLLYGSPALGLKICNVGYSTVLIQFSV